MDNIIEKPGFNGGLLFLGKLMKEDYCFRVRLVGGKVYLICSPNLQEIQKMLDALKKFRIEYQRSHGIILVSKNDALKNMVQKTMAETKTQKELERLNNAETKNRAAGRPYWQTTQGWSTCDRACGGGTQSLQRICIKPKGVGECKGPEILTKKCNLDPCPGVVEIKTKEKEKVMTAKPIVKVMPFSKRFQKYIVSNNY